MAGGPDPGQPGEPQALELEMELQRVEVVGSQDGYRLVNLVTTRGVIQTHYYEAVGATQAVVLVGGVGGGFDTPAHGLYPRLALELLAEGLSVLRVRYRHPTSLDEAVLDVLAGLAFLHAVGVTSVAVVGHSFGGAVAISASALSPLVSATATLATQSYGTGAASQLSPRPLLLMHGSADSVLPPSASEQVYRRAGEPRELRVYARAGHGLDEVADQLAEDLRTWLTAKLALARGHAAA